MAQPPENNPSTVGKEKTDKPPSRWESLGKAFDFIQKLFAIGGAVLGALAVLYLLTIGQKQTIVVGKFSVAEDVSKVGYNEAAVARELADRIGWMTYATTSLKDARAAYSYDNEPLIQIEDSSLTVKSLAEALERFRTKRRYLVTGEVIHLQDHDLRLTVRVEDHASISLTTPMSNLSETIDKMAEYVLSQTEPYIYAAYLLTQNRTDEALAQIRYCLSNPTIEDDHWAYNLWGIYFLERSRYPEAIEKFEAAVRLDPKFGLAYLNWAIALEHQDKPNAALAKYEQANALGAPLEARAGEGRMLTKLGHSNAGIRILKEVVARAPRDRTYRVELATAYATAGELRKALPELEFARDLGPFDPSLEEQYATVLDGLGLQERAFEAYEKVLAASPKNDLVRLRLQTLNNARSKP